ncbi:IGR protein motif-domain-containing protein [Nemania sp. FL0916]|nr:IGR protein motif-domain-containing protein [Nemania sp. FL0916]
MASIKPFLRPQSLRGIFSGSLPTSHSVLQSSIRSHTRAASSTTPTPSPEISNNIPPPTPLVPDVSTFLTIIGRDLKQHASKFPDWDSLFTLTSEELRELGVEPPRSRKYLIRWRQRFQRGQYGIGGDLKHVQDGVAQLRVLEAAPTAFGLPATAQPRKYVVNVPAGQTLKTCAPGELSRVQGYHVEGARTIVGPYALPLKGKEGASITLTEGMWEDRLGRKIDGGERRRGLIRYQKRVAERREARERGEL